MPDDVVVTIIVTLSVIRDMMLLNRWTGGRVYPSLATGKIIYNFGSVFVFFLKLEFHTLISSYIFFI